MRERMKYMHIHSVVHEPYFLIELFNPLFKLNLIDRLPLPNRPVQPKYF